MRVWLHAVQAQGQGKAAVSGVIAGPGQQASEQPAGSQAHLRLWCGWLVRTKHAFLKAFLSAAVVIFLYVLCSARTASYHQLCIKQVDAEASGSLAWA